MRSREGSDNGGGCCYHKEVTPKEDCELLLKDGLSFAKRMLAEHAEFYPFGRMLRPDKSIVYLAAKVEGTEFPSSAELLSLLRKRIGDEAEAGAIIASAVVYNVGNIRNPESGKADDAIQVCLDHSLNYSVEVFVPYDIDSGSDAVYGNLFAQEGRKEIFER